MAGEDVIVKYPFCPQCKNEIRDIIFQTSDQGLVVFSCPSCRVCLGAQVPAGMAIPKDQVD